MDAILLPDLLLPLKDAVLTMGKCEQRMLAIFPECSEVGTSENLTSALAWMSSCLHHTSANGFGVSPPYPSSVEIKSPPRWRLFIFRTCHSP